MNTFLLLATLSIPVQDARHSYDVALDYCRDRGGIAQYTDKGTEVRFSCGNNLTQVITILK